tara:strand:- start:70 stop:513 length:444 start_codon:yes stop_codon:yes gene_type:complete
MNQLIITSITLAIVLFLWSLLAFGPMLRAKAMILSGWELSFKQSLFVTIKASYGSMLVCGLFLYLLKSSFSIGGIIYQLIATIVFGGAWFILCSNGLLKLANSSNLITLERSRKISRSVFLHVFFGAVITLIILALIALIFIGIMKW